MLCLRLSRYKDFLTASAMFGPPQKNQNRVIQRLTDENRHLQADVQHLRQINAQLYYDNKHLETNQKKLQEKMRQMEKSHDKAVKDFTHNSRDNIIATLKYDIERLQNDKDERDKEIVELKREVDVLRTRISKVARNLLTDGNPGISDLSDPYRPQKLTETFSMLYDNKWTEAFELSDGDDEKIATYLLKLFKTTWEFCVETAEGQIDQLEKALMFQQGDKSVAPPPGCLKSLQETRKEMARELLPLLNKNFKTTKMDVKENMQPYLEGCMELCWYSAICDPPLEYVFEIGDQVADFRQYTKSGKVVDFVVWPAMYLCKHGPLMCKGVAQFRD